MAYRRPVGESTWLSGISKTEKPWSRRVLRPRVSGLQEQVADRQRGGAEELGTVRHGMVSYPLVDPPVGVSRRQRVMVRGLQDPHALSFKETFYSLQREMEVSLVTPTSIDFLAGRGLDEAEFRECYLRPPSIDAVHRQLSLGHNMGSMRHRRIRQRLDVQVPDHVVSAFIERLATVRNLKPSSRRFARDGDVSSSLPGWVAESPKRSTRPENEVPDTESRRRIRPSGRIAGGGESSLLIVVGRRRSGLAMGLFEVLTLKISTASSVVRGLAGGRPRSSSCSGLRPASSSSQGLPSRLPVGWSSARCGARFGRRSAPTWAP